MCLVWVKFCHYADFKTWNFQRRCGRETVWKRNFWEGTLSPLSLSLSKKNFKINFSRIVKWTMVLWNLLFFLFVLQEGYVLRVPTQGFDVSLTHLELVEKHGNKFERLEVTSTFPSCCMKKGSYCHYIYIFFMELLFSSLELARDLALVKEHHSIYDVFNHNALFNNNAICSLPQDAPFGPQPPHARNVWTLFCSLFNCVHCNFSQSWFKWICIPAMWCGFITKRQRWVQ